MFGSWYAKARLRTITRRIARGRRGAIAVLAGILLVVVMCVLAFAIDIGYLTSTRSELRRAVDAGALAGAGALNEGEARAISEARTLLGRNSVASRPLEEDEVEVQLGQWETASRRFVAGSAPFNAVRVAGTRRDTPLFFARVIGLQDLDVSAEAVASFQPRDIMLVLDYSASMNFDSHLNSFQYFGLDEIREGIRTMYGELGSPQYGTMEFEPIPLNLNENTIVIALGLQNVPYPYPGATWLDYIRYMNRNDPLDPHPPGFHKKFGYLTLINWWMRKRPLHSQTPDLWMTSAQPITSLKNAVTLFLDYVRTADPGDRVGLTAYTSPDATALVEHELTTDFATLDQISRRRQAGHYHPETNIGDGLRIGKEELLRTARPTAYKLLVLMTDGVANLPSPPTVSRAVSEQMGREYARQQAQAVAAAGIPVLTISLGALADQALMAEIAQMTGGIHFHVPHHKRFEDVERDLIEVFRRIAEHRPLRLVQ